MFGDFMAEMENLNLAHEAKLSAAALFDLLAQIRVYGAVYKSSGAVHACCLAKPLGDAAEMLIFVRCGAAQRRGHHRRMDVLNDVTGADKIFYTTDA